VTGPFSTVIAPIDGLAHAMAALPVARTLAELDGAPLHVVYVTSGHVAPAEALAGELGVPRDRLTRAVLDVRTGSPAVEILRVAAEHVRSVTVLCTRTRGSVHEGAFSPVTERVLAGAIGPVVLVRPERGDVGWSLGRLLLAYDGTPAASAALRPAAELGARARARVWALHVAQAGGEPPREVGSFPAPRYVDQRQHEWPTWTQEFASRLAPACPAGPTPPDLALEQGEPASAIVRFAAEHAIDLIALAWRGSLDPERAPALRAVLRDAPCPTMIVRCVEGYGR
jgi:nucleotide-binding universal stress UspA family protein